MELGELCVNRSVDDWILLERMAKWRLSVCYRIHVQVLQTLHRQVKHIF